MNDKFVEFYNKLCLEPCMVNLRKEKSKG